MILWSGNYVIEESTIEPMVDKLKTYPKAYNHKFNHHSSYYLNHQDRPENCLHTFYLEILNQVTKDLTLYNRIRFKYPFWMQVYGKNTRSNHGQHDHFSGGEALSWVHFIQPTAQKCFHFVDVNGENVYPKQDKGDFIVFPASALHRVDNNTSNQARIIIAGNVGFEQISVEHVDNVIQVSTLTEVSKFVRVWETYEEGL